MVFRWFKTCFLYWGNWFLLLGDRCLSRITGFIIVFITETTNVSSSEKMYPLVLKLVLTGCFEYNFIGKIDLIKLYRNLQLVNPKYLI